MSDNLREKSRRQWTNPSNATADIQLGAILRIADAAEIMAQNFVRLQNDLDYYKAKSSRLQKDLDRVKNSRAGYKAALTKLRQQQEAE